ncbi:MAG: FtsW/RodA/SpoVE family cell cycle protein [Paludibacteraceae bacterium]|nr:FtsW/RodA/SpoVE family cell cycle protein [Paludibacteraceae bacterium]
MKEFIQKNFKGDKIVWIVFIVLIVISSMEMYSASSSLAYKQASYISPVWRHIGFLGFGFLIAFFVHLFSYKKYPAVFLLLSLLTVFLLILSLLMGVSANNASRWLALGGVQFQPSELAKLCLIVMLSHFLAKAQEDNKSTDGVFNKCLIGIAITAILIFPENLSTALLVCFIGFALMWYGRVSLKRLFALLAVVLTIAVVFFISIPYLPNVRVFHRAKVWYNRVEMFQEKGGEDKQSTFKINDENYQESHAKIAVSNSHLWGRGIGNSIERDFLPQAYSDFIFAIIIEETGLIGGGFVVLLYLVLFYRAGYIAKRCTSAFPALLVLGLSTMILLQAFMNIAVAVGVIPVTGQTLPMISRGGTSILVISVYFGMILSVSRYGEVDQNTEEVKNKEV